MENKDDIELEMQEIIEEEPATQEKVSLKEEASEMKEHAKKTIQKIKEKVKEEDTRPTSSLNLRTILGGDFLTSLVYVAFRYQCQQDLIAIDKLEKELLDAKYKALSSSSTLTEMCRESHVLDALKQNNDSLLHISDQPPYIINIPE